MSWRPKSRKIGSLFSSSFNHKELNTFYYWSAVRKICRRPAAPHKRTVMRNIYLTSMPWRHNVVLSQISNFTLIIPLGKHLRRLKFSTKPNWIRMSAFQQDTTAQSCLYVVWRRTTAHAGNITLYKVRRGAVVPVSFVQNIANTS